MEKLHRHFELELKTLSERVLRLGGFAEQAIGNATQALKLPAAQVRVSIDFRF